MCVFLFSFWLFWCVWLWFFFPPAPLFNLRNFHKPLKRFTVHTMHYVKRQQKVAQLQYLYDNPLTLHANPRTPTATALGAIKGWVCCSRTRWPVVSSATLGISKTSVHGAPLYESGGSVAWLNSNYPGGIDGQHIHSRWNEKNTPALSF